MIDYQMAEYAVIGCLLIDERCFPIVQAENISVECFANSNCRTAFETVCALAGENKLIDAVCVATASELPHSFLAECMEIAPTCNNIAEYAKAVIDGHKRRKLREIAEKLEMESLLPAVEVSQAVNDARAALDVLVQSSGGGRVQTPHESIGAFLEFREEVKTGKRKTVKTGFTSVDGILGGFAQGGLYIVAARPGVGKSAFGVAVGDMLAKRHKVLYASLEMTVEELNARRVASFSATPCSFGKLLFGATTEGEDAEILNACAELSERKMYISAVSSMTVAELGIEARNINAEIIIVDYLGLLTGADRKMSEYERITQVSGDLKRLAKQLNCVVIALCQLNRESVNGYGGTESRPKLSQLRSSGAIEQDADGVLLLHRPEYGQTNIQRPPTVPQQFFVDIAKNRHGRTGTAELHWYAPNNRFEDRGGQWTVKSWK